MSVHKFAEWLGVTHAAVLNWESEEKKMNADTEINMRLHVLNHLKVTDREFRKIYNQLDRKNLAKRRIESIILAGMSANLCVESHMREFIEQGFEVAIVKDATAATQVEEADGYAAALINFRMIASDVWTTEEAVKKINAVE